MTLLLRVVFVVVAVLVLLAAWGLLLSGSVAGVVIGLVLVLLAVMLLGRAL